MTVISTLTPGGVRCKHCPAVYRRGDETAARVAGWRIWRGRTLSGGEREDVVCSACAGTAAPLDADETDSRAGWRVRCHTCDWDTTEEDDSGEGPMTAKQAKDQADFHYCEPEVQIAPPDGDDWYHPYRITDEGVLRA